MNIEPRAKHVFPKCDPLSVSKPKIAKSRLPPKVDWNDLCIWNVLPKMNTPKGCEKKNLLASFLFQQFCCFFSFFLLVLCWCVLLCQTIINEEVIICRSTLAEPSLTKMAFYGVLQRPVGLIETARPNGKHLLSIFSLGDCPQMATEPYCLSRNCKSTG